MSREHSLLFELEAGPFSAADLVVARMSGEEALSELFVFRVELFSASGDPLQPRDLLHVDATLSMRGPEGVERFVNGWIEEVVDLGIRHGRPEYRVRVVPRVRQLQHVHRCRIFQNLSVPDIVAKVLKAAKVEHRLALSGSYPAREYCVQYRESDLDFIRRLLEAEGICFFFEHGAGSHVMVLGDSVQAHAAVEGDATVPFRAYTGQVEEDGGHVTAVARTHGLQVDKVVLRDFDFERPLLDLTTGSPKVDEGHGLELYDYPGDYSSPDEGKRLSKVRLEEQRFGVETLACEGTCHRLTPGFTFSIAEHPDSDFNRELLVVRVRHEGRGRDMAMQAQSVGGAYRNTVLTLPAEAPYRPRRSTRRPRVAGIQTATVVAPSGEELQPDAHGRIKVQFHWDREGQHNDQSSCWVRVGQSWAGAGWGASFIPRVGQEVVVRFLEGDPDRALVVGAVYNGSNPPPLGLPGEKTKSTQRTDSSPGSGGLNGFNELRFEDAAGEEEVYLHAQKDGSLRTLNDKTQTIGGNEALIVEKDRSREVNGNQALGVKLDDDATVEGSQMLTVAAMREIRVKGDHAEEIAGNQTITVGAAHALNVNGAAAFTVGAAAALTVGAAYAVNVALAYNKAVGGARLEQVGGLRSEEIGLHRTESVAGDRSSTVFGEVEEQIEGGYSQSIGADRKDESDKNHLTEVAKEVGLGAKELKFQADEAAVVVGGELALLINKSGTVKIWAKHLTVDGSQIKLKGSKIKKKADGSGKKKPFQEVLDPSQATRGKTFQGNDGPLKPKDAAAFKDGKYTEMVLKKNVTVYRLHGGIAEQRGRWVCAGLRPTGLEGKIRMALHPTWGCTAERATAMTLVKGTTVYEGLVAGQGAGYAGGATQILIKVPDRVAAAGSKAIEKFFQSVLM